MMYVRLLLSLQNVEALLFERGTDLSHATVRTCWNGFAPLFAGDIRRQRVSQMKGFRQWRWHLDEMYVKLNGEMVYLWRAFDQEGEIFESYITRTRDKEAAMNALGNEDKQAIGRWANVHNHFNQERHLVDRQTYKDRRLALLAEWQSIKGLKPRTQSQGSANRRPVAVRLTARQAVAAIRRDRDIAPKSPGFRAPISAQRRDRTRRLGGPEC